MLSKHVTFTGLLLATLGFGLQSLKAEWYPPSEISRQEIIEASGEVLAMPDLPISAEEDLYRIRAVEMEWDMGAMVYQPQDDAKIPTDPAGRKIGVFLIHGGSGDHRSKDKEGRFLSGKFGFKVVSMLPEIPNDRHDLELEAGERLPTPTGTGLSHLCLS